MKKKIMSLLLSGIFSVTIGVEAGSNLTWSANSMGKAVKTDLQTDAYKFQLPRLAPGQFKLIASCNVWKNGLLKTGNWDVTFDFKSENPDMILIPCIRVFDSEKKSRFIYNTLKKSEYPEPGEWGTVKKTFTIPEGMVDAQFIVECRDNTDSEIILTFPDVIYKGK